MFDDLPDNKIPAPYFHRDLVCRIVLYRAYFHLSGRKQFQGRTRKRDFGKGIQEKCPSALVRDHLAFDDPYGDIRNCIIDYPSGIIEIALHACETGIGYIIDRLSFHLSLDL